MNMTVVIPCYNEGKTITKVIEDFKEELPEASIVVFDNNSTDNTISLARNAGAKVINVRRRGKGYVIQKMFELIDTDFYVLVDGDGTYSAKDIHKLIQPIIKEEADMVVGRRYYTSGAAMKKLNKLGNIFFSKLLSLFFGVKFEDILSGYRVMNKKFARSVPIFAEEFEVETEITLQALAKGMVIREVPISYKKRPLGSISKLHPLRDGYAIFLTIFSLFRDLKPLTFFASISIVLWLSALIYGLIVYYLPQSATLFDAILLTSLTVTGFLFVFGGLLLHTLNRRFTELVAILKKD